MENITSRGENWDQDAACGELMRGSPETFDEYFYPEPAAGVRAVTRMAIKICQACPVQLDCLRDALQHEDGWGIKGGKTPAQRKDILKGIPRQRDGA